MDYDDESDGVQEDPEEFDDILGNESNGDDGQDDFECDDVIGLSSTKTIGWTNDLTLSCNH